MPDKLFSQRHAQPPPQLRYDIPEIVRKRILATLFDHASQAHGGIERLLHDVGKTLIKSYGALRGPGWEAARTSNDPVIQHFYSCTHEHALDFVEAAFRQVAYGGGQAGVDEVNAILRECGIGYELTPYVVHHVEKDRPFLSRLWHGAVIEREYPQVVRLDSVVTHEAIVAPALQLLTDSRFRIPNDELLRALKAIRHGEAENALTLCCSAFESFLKTICDLKGWSHDPQRDTCSRLVSVCSEHGLIPPFYTPMMVAVGTVRNKIGDAHGRGPKPDHEAASEHAEHLVHICAAHMLLLAKLAGVQ